MASLMSIEGIGAEFGKKLAAGGCRSTQALLEMAGPAKGRKELAASTGISEKLLLEWVNRADLMRVKGVGEEYSDLLENAGVDSCSELAQRNAANLLAAMTEVNAKKKLVRRLPPEATVQAWIAQAKKLGKVVGH